MFEPFVVVLRRLLGAIVGERHGADERRKRTFLVIVLAFLVPAILLYALADLLRGRPVDATAGLGLAALFAAAVAWCRGRPSILPALRVIFVCTILVVLREIAAGGGEGFAFLWAYLLPVCSFVVFGKVEGWRWVGVLLAGAVGTMVAAPVGYETALVSRFLVTSALVALLAFAIESSRAEATRALNEQKEALEQALGQIRTLSGLLPICASCKKIRDDRGYWTQVEHYIAARTDAQFSHGICPDCAESHYPQLAAELRRREAARQPELPYSPS